MDGLYTEAYVKRKKTALSSIGKPLMVIGGIILFVLGMIISGTSAIGYLFSVLGIGMWVALLFVGALFNTDYEYIFCDGQIDFDRIAGGEKRKTMLRVDMDRIEIIAPETSHRLDSFRHQEGVTVKDFSSKDPENKKYALFTSDQKAKYFVIFEPTEKMLDFARQKGPRKVFFD